MTNQPSHTEPDIDTIFDLIKETRERRDATARNACDCLLNGDSNAAMWHANAFAAYQIEIDGLMQRMKELIPD